MDVEKRKHYLKIINAGALTALVDQAIKRNPTEQKKPSGNSWYSVSLGSFGEGSAVALVPANVVKPDGTVDFVFTFKSIGPGDKSTAAKTGVNAVFVTCYVSEAGSAKHTLLFGTSSFVSNSVAKVLADLKGKYPDKTLKPGKVALTSWSGGYGPVRQILSERASLASKGIEISSVVLADGLHSSGKALEPFIQFAREAAKDPSKRFTTITTGVDPGSYISSTKASKLVSEAVGGVQEREWNGVGAAPEATHGSGGYQHIELWKPGPYSEATMKGQHAGAYRWTNENKGNLAHLLGWD